MSTKAYDREKSFQAGPGYTWARRNPEEAKARLDAARERDERDSADLPYGGASLAEIKAWQVEG